MLDLLERQRIASAAASAACKPLYKCISLSPASEDCARRTQSNTSPLRQFRHFQNSAVVLECADADHRSAMQHGHLASFVVSPVLLCILLLSSCSLANLTVTAILLICLDVM